MNSEFPRKAWYLPLGVILGWFVLSLLLKPLYAPLEDRLVDARFRLRGEQAIDSTIVVLYLDNDQVASLGGWPIRRSYYALMVDVLHRLGASIVATDIFFQSRVPEYPEYDDLLVGVVREADNLVLPGYFKSVEWRDTRYVGSGFLEPYDNLRDAALAVGHANISEGPRVSAIPAFIQRNGESVPALGIAVARAYAKKRHLDLPDIPEQDRVTFTLNYRGGTEQLNALPMVEFLRSFDLLEKGGAPAVDFSSVKNKIVLIAATGEGRAIFFSNPFSKRYPSVGLHATVIDNILRGSYFANASSIANSLWTLAAAGVVLLLFRLFTEARAFMWAGIAGIFVLLVPLGLFIVFDYSIVMTSPLLSLTGSSFTLLILRHRHAERRLEALTLDRERIESELRSKEARLRAAERELLEAKREASAQQQQKLIAELTRYRQDIRSLTAQATDLEEFRTISDVSDRHVFEEIVYASGSKIEPLVEMVKKIASAEAPVLILGESGTGKELVARAIHRLSQRKANPFVTVNCGALSETLLESELFGHEKGAFTGAVKEKPGRFELADGGSIFLDEIAETSEAFQVKMLRVLQQGEFERVGGTATLKVNVRVLAATNRDPKALIQAKKFREDLYYRLNVFVLNLPPLRERRGDLPMLVQAFVEREGLSLRISANVMDAFLNHEWRGNVRELESVIKRAAVLAKAEKRDLIRMKDIPEEVAAAIKEKIDIEDQIMESLREKGFSRNSISETAEELGGFNRGTIAEYFRGICLRTLVEHGMDIDVTMRTLSGSEDRAVHERVRKKVLEYLVNAVGAVDRSKSVEETKRATQAKYKNLPQRYHLFLSEIVETYHRGEWDLPKELSES